jgi:hypothetical protein
MRPHLFAFILGVREPPGPRRRWLFYGLYAAAALATLAKGPIGFLIPGAVMFLWLLVFNQWHRLRPLHLPTGLVVSMQDEKSQIKNREKAMRVLRARLQEIEEQKQHDALSAERKSMVGSGDRSEKIRTYNFKENRVTDHRIGMTVHQLDLVMEGALDDFVEALRTHYQTEKLKAEAVNA